MLKASYPFKKTTKWQTTWLVLCGCNMCNTPGHSSGLPLRLFVFASPPKKMKRKMLYLSYGSSMKKVQYMITKRSDLKRKKEKNTNTWDVTTTKMTCVKRMTIRKNIKVPRTVYTPSKPPFLIGFCLGPISLRASCPESSHFLGSSHNTVSWTWFLLLASHADSWWFCRPCFLLLYGSCAVSLWAVGVVLQRHLWLLMQLICNEVDGFNILSVYYALYLYVIYITFWMNKMHNTSKGTPQNGEYGVQLKSHLL